MIPDVSVPPVLVVVPWPRWPTVTPGGKESASKRAGKLVPWLSTNVVGTLHPRLYREVKIMWREAAAASADGSWPEGFGCAVEVLVKLYKPTAQEMDPLAVLEGLKPVVDGLEASGLLVNDRQVIGGWAEALKAGSRDECRVEVTLAAVAP